MKYFLSLFLFSTMVFTFGQSIVDFEQIINSWTQGKIDHHGKVIQADINRGGWYQLEINKDSTVAFSAPDDCGFGEGKREGSWKLNQNDTSVTFSFSKHIGYMAYPGTIYINETETYKIKKLNAAELILLQTLNKKERIMPFVVTKI